MAMEMEIHGECNIHVFPREPPQTWKWLMDHWTWKLGHGNPIAHSKVGIPNSRIIGGSWRVDVGAMEASLNVTLKVSPTKMLE